jgi:5-methylcytosine-specific restriction endonuclease McrA
MGRARKYATYAEAQAAQRAQVREWIRRRKSELGPFAHWTTFWRSVAAHLRREGVKALGESAPPFRKKRRKRERGASRVYARLDIHKALAGRFRSMVRRSNYRLFYTLSEYRAHILGLLSANHFLCPYCRERLEGAAFHVDHKTPIRRGGDDALANLQPICADCNSRKGNLTHEEFQTELASWFDRG